jgi:hypothetical protein
LASLANPHTYHLHLFIAEYLRAPYLNNVAEFMSVSFRSPAALNFELLLLPAVALIGWSVYRRRYAEALFVAAWAHLALIAGRNIPIFAIAAAPVAAQSLMEILTALVISPLSGRLRRPVAAFLDTGTEVAKIDLTWRVPVLSAAVFAILALLMTAPAASGKLRAEFAETNFPVNAMPALQRCGTGRVFTRDQWGDYLIYRLYPAMRVYMDGRSDFYGNDFVNEYTKVITASHGWDRILDRYAVDRALLPVDEALASVLKATPGWRVVYDDHKAILFEKSALRADNNDLSDHSIGRAGCDSLVAAAQSRGEPPVAGINRGLRATY